MPAPYNYLYFDKKKQKVVKRRKFSRFLHDFGDNRYTYIGKEWKHNRRVKLGYMAGKHRYRNMYSEPMVRKTLDPLKECGYSTHQIWVGLCRCWLGLTISKSKNNYDKMVYYARGIHKMQRQLGFALTDFDFMVTPDPANDSDDSIFQDKDLFNENMTDEEWEDYLFNENTNNSYS